jgi:C4-dicarboxylate transporter DctM subunit
MFVWMAKFGAAYGVRTGIHVGVDVLINRLSDRTAASSSSSACSPAHCSPASSEPWVPFRLGKRRALRDFQGDGLPVGDVPEGPTTPDLEWPTWIVYSGDSAGQQPDVLPLPAGAGGTSRTGELPHHDHGHVDGLEDETPPVDVNPYSKWTTTCTCATSSTPWWATTAKSRRADRSRSAQGRPGRRAEMNAAIIFLILLAALMLTGMPISISLGLTVLSFLFLLTQVPLESVALKLFTGIEKFEIMAIPFFILAGNFLTHGGVAKRMINFASSMVGHWYGGLGLGGRAGLRPVRRDFRVVAGNRGGDRLDPAAGDGQGGFPEQVRRRRDHHLGRWAS